jgi:integrase
MTEEKSTPKLPAGLYRRPKTKIIWCKYYVNGLPKREPTGAASVTEAKRYLASRKGAAADGKPILPRVARVRYEEAAAGQRAHYKRTGTRGAVESEARLRHLDPFFRGNRFAGIEAEAITKYQDARQAEGAANRTINRETGVLSKMLRLAYKHGKLLRLPVIERLKEATPRQGFFEREQFEAVCRQLKPDLQVAVALAHSFGWRMQTEVLSLELRQLDLAASPAGKVRFDVGATKNDDGREVHLTPDLQRLVLAQVERVRGLERQLGRIIPFLFPHPTGRRRQGHRRRDFRKAWATACHKAGIPGMLRHDFRRTAVRDLVNDGIPENVAMTITGHKTREVFDRYHIVAPADLREAARRMTSGRRNAPRAIDASQGHSYAHSGPVGLESRSATL